MDEHRRLHAAKTATYLRGVQQRARRFALAAAIAEERKNESNVQDRRDAKEAMFVQWSTLLGQSFLDQDAIKRFAENTVRQEFALNAAQAELDTATRERRLANDVAGEAQVRFRQVAQLLQRLRKRARRRRDERALQALEDRVAYDCGDRA
ncbi:MAG: hypothetical protein WAU68_12225 [Vitreimonas sp.]